nr:hypothetical protein [Streptomyces sp. SID4926]
MQNSQQKSQGEAAVPAEQAKYWVKTVGRGAEILEALAAGGPGGG